MGRLDRLAVSMGVACLLLTSTLVVAQVTKGEAKAKADAAAKPGGTTTTTVEKKVVAKKVVAKKAARVEAAEVQVLVAPAVANLNPMVQQFSQQLRPIVLAEYHLVCALGKPSKEQRRRIARDGVKALHETATKFAEMQQNGHVRILGRRPSNPNPRAMIEEAISASAKANLPAEAFDRYRKEADLRAENRRRTIIRNLVARLDEALALMPDQRDKLARSIADNWQDEWCPSVEMFMYVNQFFPSIPDQFVVPHLNDKQRAIWQSSPKQMLNFWGVFGFVGGMADSSPLEDDELAEARKEREELDRKAAEAAGAGPAPAVNVMMKGAVIRKAAPKAAAKKAAAEKAQAK